MIDQRIDVILSLTRGPSVLDVGCTGGLQTDVPMVDQMTWLHRHLADEFDDVWGIDLSASKITSVTAHGYDNLHVADAQDFDLNRKFDTIVAGELIEHLPNPAAFLQCARRHLNEGGRVVLTTPYVFSANNVLYAWLKYPKTCGNPEHTAWFCPRTLTTLVNLAGFDVASLNLIESYGPGPGRLHNAGLVAYRGFRFLMPRRLRTNCMVITLAAR